MSRALLALALAMTPTSALAVNWSAWHVPGDDCPTIPAGVTVSVDADVDVSRLVINGTLDWNGGSWDLTAEQIDIMSGGTLRLGTAASPYTADVEINLTSDPTVTCPGSTVDRELRVHSNGALRMHGDYKTGGGAARVPWTRLADTAPAGQDYVVLQQGVDWAVGDTIVVASTDFDLGQAEQRTITGLSTTTLVNDTVHFAADPLAVDHWGEDEGLGAFTVAERGEVGLLTRNLHITGDTTVDAFGNTVGGQVKVMAGGGPPALARMTWVELTNLGATNTLGVYPLHFHLAGDQSASYVRGLSIHDNHFRAITIHETDNLRVTGNVASESSGHLYYLEAGDEVGNVLRGNLGLGARRVALVESDCLAHGPLGTGQLACVDSDVQPGVFYLRDPDNTVEDNAAAGSEGHGFYLAPGDGATGVPTSFDGNSSHSNQIHGMFQDDAADPASLATYSNHTSWKNRQYGVWLRSWGDADLVGFRLADNRAGSYLASGGWQASYSLITLQDALMIGESNNLGEVDMATDEACAGRSLPLHSLSDPLTGFDTYDGRTIADGVTFAAYNPLSLDCDGDGSPDTTRPAGAFSQTHKENRWAVDPRNASVDSTFHGSTNEVWFRDPFLGPSNGASGVASVVLVDADGTITGTAGDRIVPDNPLLVPAGAVFEPAWNAWTAASTHGWGQVEVLDRDWHHRRVFVVADHDAGATRVRIDVPPSNSSSRLPFNVLADVGTTYRYDLSWPAGAVPNDMRLKLRFTKPGAEVLLVLPYTAAPPSQIRVGGVPIAAETCAMAAGCVGTSVEGATVSAWHHTAGALTVKLVTPSGGSITDFIIEETMSVVP